MAQERNCFSAPVLEEVSKILGDTNIGLKGSDIAKLLAQADIVDTNPTDTKWRRIYYAFANNQITLGCSNNILNFIKYAYSPSKYVNIPGEFEEKRRLINQQISFIGYQYNENGTFSEIKKATTISEAQIRANTLKAALENRNAHSDIFKYCKAELVDNNYFHAVFEANKGLLQRIRELSGYQYDGIGLIQHVFSSNPILIVNKFQSSSEINEHTGYCRILEGLCSMFRNPESHEPKISWEVSEQDALEILSMISYCHRRLDNHHKIR